jgi:hypothetical protein
MKKIFFQVSLFYLTLVVLSGAAFAQPVNLLGNPSFESPGFDAQDLGFSLAYPWQDDGINYTNTGVENIGAHSGTYRAFEMSGDDGAYQISTTASPLNVGDKVVLTWWALGTYNGTNNSFTGTGPTDPLQIVGILTAASTSDPFSSTTSGIVKSNGVSSSGWIQYTLSYTATAADAGRYPGCFFNTQQVGGNTQNSFAAYDDFALYVFPAGSLPVITASPASQTAAAGANISLSVTALNATSYQWQAGAPGNGIYTNLPNSGGFSGVTTPTLNITGVTTNDNLDFVAVVSNGNGSVTSAPPANVTVVQVIYQENFNLPTSPDQPISEVGWMNDIAGNFGGRVFAAPNNGVTFPNMAVYSYVGNATTEAFYGTTKSINGGPYPASPNPVTNKMAFPGVNLQNAQNVSFSVDLNSPYNPGSTHSFICVQMNFGSWYVSTTELTQPSSTAFVTDTLNFNPSASAWDQLTVSGTGSDSSVYTPVIGSGATGDLTGYITGIGIVCTHAGGSTVQFDNYKVLGAIPFTLLPVINSPPSNSTNYTGTTATFSVSATTNGSNAGLTYQWKAGTVGSGVYANLSNGGQFSGVNSSTLVISNVTSAANHKDYVVVVSDGAGSVTSSVPATLTVVDSAPILTSDAVIYPNTAILFGSTNVTIEAGNNNVLNLAAAFIGDQPIGYHWQFNTQPNSVGAVNVAGATNATYTISNPQTNATGYYSLQVTNSQSVTPTNSSWVQLTVLPAADAVIQWAAPVAINGLTSAQILGLPGTFLEAETFGAAVPLSVTNGATVFLFDNTQSAVSINGSVKNWIEAYTGPSTGDANLDTILGTDNENNGFGITITLNNLTVGQRYSVQLIALNDIAASSRQASFSNAGDAADVSSAFTAGQNVYVTGIFTATNTIQTIIENQADGHGYTTAAIVRIAPSTPTLSIQRISPTSLQVNYANGILLQSTNVTGPWTTNSAASPYIFTPTGPKVFFKAQH